MIEAVAFDLDGTLADTAGLTSGRRVPGEVLAVCRPGSAVDPIGFGQEVNDLPSKLIALGVPVVVVTRSPAAYASTVLGLLGVDYCRLYASVQPDAIADKLAEIARSLGVAPKHFLYVGDRVEDQRAASAAGVAYQKAPWLNGLPARVGGVDGPIRRCWASPASPTEIGGSRTVTVLGEAVRSGRPVTEETIDALEQDPNRTPEEVAALCFVSLLAAPAQHHRALLQHLALKGMPAEARYCSLRRTYWEGIVGFPAEFITRLDLAKADDELRRDHDAALRRLFPLHRLSVRDGLADVKGYAAVPYKMCKWGEGFWAAAKDWADSGSGKRPYVSLLGLPAAVLGAHLVDRVSRPLVPAPSTAFSTSQPAQASLRLTWATAAASEREVCDVLVKETDGTIRCTQQGGGRSVLLIDDQITSGSTTRRSIAALRAAEWQVMGVFAWSASRSNISRSAATESSACWLSPASRLLGVSHNCPTHQEDTNHTSVTMTADG